MSENEENFTDNLQKAKEAHLLYLEEVKNELSLCNTDFKELPPPISINVRKINEVGYIENLSKDLPLKGMFLYYFSINNSELIFKDFQLFRNGKTSDTKLTKLNEGNKGSKYLYVGSSNSIKRRFNEHCGKAHDKTYALKLSKWLKHASSEIKFNYVEVIGVKQIILQHLEDALWRELKPMFGKSGANNKS